MAEQSETSTYKVNVAGRRELEDIRPPSSGLLDLDEASIAREENQILLDIVRRAVLPNEVQQLIVASHKEYGALDRARVNEIGALTAQRAPSFEGKESLGGHDWSRRCGE